MTGCCTQIYICILLGCLYYYFQGRPTLRWRHSVKRDVERAEVNERTNERTIVGGNGRMSWQMETIRRVGGIDYVMWPLRHKGPNGRKRGGRGRKKGSLGRN